MAAACLLGSCSKDNSSDEQPGQSQISITGGGVINAGPDGAEQAITVTSMGDWRLAGSSDWAHPSATSGKSGDVVTFTVDSNTGKETLEAQFKFFAGATVVPLKVISTPIYQLVLESEAKLDYDEKTHTLQVKLQTNIPELTMAFSDGGEEWIHFDNRSEVFGAAIVSFTVDANPTYADRTSVITINGKDAAPVTITVNQEQTDIIIPEKLSYSLDLTGGTLAIKLETNIEYQVEVPSKYGTWLHYQSVTPPAPQLQALPEHTESFTIDAVDGLRTGKINFKSLDGSYSVTVTIVQNGDKHVYATIPDMNFQKYLVAEDFIVVVEGAKCELTFAGQQATSFSCNSKSIKSFEGITAFTNLTSLACKSNPLDVIALGDLAITSLDISNNYYFPRNVAVSSTNLTTLNIYYSTTIYELDVSECPVLADLNISYCSYISKLHLKTGQVITKLNDAKTGQYTDAKTYEKVYK